MVNYLLPIGGYLLGSISSAILVARIMRLPDPRDAGSGNPGATNILRIGSKSAAAITLLGDLFKGVVAIVVTKAISDDPLILALVAVAVFLGHLYPVFFSFKGGKGVATALGVYLALAPCLGLTIVVTWVLVAIVTKYSSLAALVAAVLSPLYVWYWLDHSVFVYISILIAALLIWRHRQNISRLIDGSEPRIGNRN
ncbi:glycerol-3-phosphate 1-O-acyltransferase PlsY [Pseudomonadota bacterium]